MHESAKVPNVPPPPLDCERLPGELLRVPNTYWQIPSIKNNEHPGACFFYDPQTELVYLVKGGTSLPARYFGYDEVVFIEPSDSNHFRETTVFRDHVRTLTLRRLALLRKNRYLGRLTVEELDRILQLVGNTRHITH